MQHEITQQVVVTVSAAAWHVNFSAQTRKIPEVFVGLVWEKTRHLFEHDGDRRPQGSLWQLIGGGEGADCTTITAMEKRHAATSALH